MLGWALHTLEQLVQAWRSVFSSRAPEHPQEARQMRQCAESIIEVAEVLR